MDNRIDDWPGRRAFNDLGEFIDTVKVSGIGGSITVGLFKFTDQDRTTIYAASSRPWLVGMGADNDAAIDDWVIELAYKWDQAKELRRPYAPAVENDIDAMGIFFGTQPYGTQLC